MFYDLQIWNASPPSCLRLDHAQLVRGTHEHSLLIHTTYKKPAGATQLTNCFKEIFEKKLRELLKCEGSNMLHPLYR